MNADTEWGSLRTRPCVATNMPFFGTRRKKVELSFVNLAVALC